MAENKDLKKHQQAMLCMLKEVDRICSKYGIRYVLFAGTCLGAVRHGGFIPWDDDLDIIMFREDYNKFLTCAEKEVDSEKFYLQKEFSQHWPIYYSKLRMNNTTCFECFYPKDQRMHQGVYIDIFPCDNLSDNKLIQKIQFMASKIVIAKSLYKRGYIAEGFAKQIFIQACRILPLKPFWSIAVNENNRTKLVHSFFAASSKFHKSIYERTWFEKTQKVKFEDGQFPIPVHYDELLTTLYGEYMAIPSEDTRKMKVHSMFVDLDESYTKHLDIQTTLKFEVLTRSIR